MSPFSLLLILNAMCMTAMMAFVPVIGPIIRELGLSEWHSGIIVAMSGVAWLLSARFWGSLSDRLGRKPVIIGAALGFTASYLLMTWWIDMSLAGTWSATVVLVGMIVARSLIGLFYAAMMPVSAALIADITEPSKRQASMAGLGAANAIGMVAGPALGGWLAQYSLTLPLYTLSILPFIGLLYAQFTLPKSKQVHQPATKPLGIFDAKIRLPAFAMLACMFTAVTSQMIIGFLILDRMSDSPQQTAQLSGLAMTLTGVTLVVTQGILMKSKRDLLAASIKYGPLVAVVGLLMTAFAYQPWLLMVGYVFAALGLGFVFPSIQAVTANSVDKNEQGLAAGTISAVQGLSSIIVPITATIIYPFHTSLPYLLSALMLVILSVFAISSGKKKEMNQTQADSIG